MNNQNFINHRRKCHQIKTLTDCGPWRQLRTSLLLAAPVSRMLRLCQTASCTAEKKQQKIFIHSFIHSFSQSVIHSFLCSKHYSSNRIKKNFFWFSKFGSTLPPCSREIVGAGGFVSGGGHFCGICQNCWNHFWKDKMYVWCRYAWPRAHGVKIANFHVFQFWICPR